MPGMRRDRLALWGRILPISSPPWAWWHWWAERCWGRSPCAREKALIDPGLGRGRSPVLRSHAGPRPTGVPGAEAQTEEVWPPSDHPICLRQQTGLSRAAPGSVAFRLAYALALARIAPMRHCWCWGICCFATLLRRRACPCPIRRWGCRRRRRAPCRRTSLLRWPLGWIAWGWRRETAAGVPRASARGSAHAPLAGPQAGMAGQFVAVTITVWKIRFPPISAGARSLLVGYGCLPWVRGRARLRRQSRGASDVCALVFSSRCRADPDRADVGCNGRGGVRFRVGSRPAAWWCTAAAWSRCRWRCLGWPRRRFPIRCRPHRRAFAVRRAEPVLGTLGSFAEPRSIWNADAVPGRARHFSWSSRRLCCSYGGHGLPTWCADPSRRRC